MPRQQPSSDPTVFARVYSMSPSGLKQAPGPSMQGLALTPSGQSRNMPPRFWPSSASGSEREEEICANLIHGRVTSSESERRTYDTRSSFLSASFQVKRTPKSERRR